MANKYDTIQYPEKINLHKNLLTQDSTVSQFLSSLSLVISKLRVKTVPTF